MLQRKIYLLVLVGAIGFCALAQTSSKTQQNKERFQKTELPSWEWTKEPWTGDDKPFIKIRTRIDAEIARTPARNLSALVTQYETAATKEPNDRAAQFAWSYAAFQARKAGYDFSDRQWGTPLNASFNLAEVPSPHAYQYSRLQFLMAMWWREFPQLKVLGLRLLKRNPNDYDVKFYVVGILSSGNDKEQEQAIVYAQELVKMQPKRPSAYSALGGSYWLAFRGTDNTDKADKAIAAYRKYLELVPANDKSRPKMENLIQLIEEQKAKGKDWWKEKQ